jgi:hypothetical protein
MRSFVQLCKMVDDTESAYKKAIGLGKDEYAAFVAAKSRLMEVVKLEMETLAGRSGFSDAAAHQLTYFNTWVLLRGGLD